MDFAAYFWIIRLMFAYITHTMNEQKNVQIILLDCTLNVTSVGLLTYIEKLRNIIYIIKYKVIMCKV